MKAFYASGDAGAIIQLDDGRFADTVVGETSETIECHEALNTLVAEAELADWVATPLFGDFDAIELGIYLNGDDPWEILTLSEAATIYPLAYATLAQATREGRLEAHRSGPKTWLTTRAAIEEAIASGRLRPRNK